MNDVSINPEIARLAQFRVKSSGASLTDELARIMAEQAVIDLDPELNLMLDGCDAYSQNDTLVQSLGVNDLVVNGHHIDVRAINPDGNVLIRRALIVRRYLASGSLVVNVNDSASGRVIAYIPAQLWRDAENGAGDDQFAEIHVNTGSTIDLSQVLQSITAHPAADGNVDEPTADATELERFLSFPRELNISAQRRVAAGLLHSHSLQNRAAEIIAAWSNSKVRSILTAASIWNVRVDKLTDRLSCSFKKIPRQQIKGMVERLGETFGGQPEAPEFKSLLLKSLMREEMVKRLPSIDVVKLSSVAERVWSGKAVSEAVGHIVKNRVAVDLALTIRRKRQQVEGFIAASADEIGMAFQQLALQPAYATHSHDPGAGVESINEALVMLEVAELAQEIKQLERDLF